MGCFSLAPSVPVCSSLSLCVLGVWCDDLLWWSGLVWCLKVWCYISGHFVTTCVLVPRVNRHQIETVLPPISLLKKLGFVNGSTRSWPQFPHNKTQYNNNITVATILLVIIILCITIITTLLILIIYVFILLSIQNWGKYYMHYMHDVFNNKCLDIVLKTCLWIA